MELTKYLKKSSPEKKQPLTDIRKLFFFLFLNKKAHSVGERKESLMHSLEATFWSHSSAVYGRLAWLKIMTSQSCQLLATSINWPEKTSFWHCTQSWIVGLMLMPPSGYKQVSFRTTFQAENTNLRGSLTIPLYSCLFSLHSAALLLLN